MANVNAYNTAHAGRHAGTQARRQAGRHARTNARTHERTYARTNARAHAITRVCMHGACMHECSCSTHGHMHKTRVSTIKHTCAPPPEVALPCIRRTEDGTRKNAPTPSRVLARALASNQVRMFLHDYGPASVRKLVIVLLACTPPQKNQRTVFGLHSTQAQK